MTEVTRITALDEMLDECYEAVTICGIEFSASDILATLDPIAYNEAAADGGYLEYEEEEEEEE